MQRTHSLVRDETFPGRGPSRDDFQDVETNSLGQRSALADDNLVAFLASKRRGNVRGNVRVSLFVSLVLFDKVQVIHAEDDGAVHFVDLTTPDKILPLMETLPVNGHFLSI